MFPEKQDNPINEKPITSEDVRRSRRTLVARLIVGGLLVGGTWAGVEAGLPQKAGDAIVEFADDVYEDNDPLTEEQKEILDGGETEPNSRPALPHEITQ